MVQPPVFHDVDYVHTLFISLMCSIIFLSCSHVRRIVEGIYEGVVLSMDEPAELPWQQLHQDYQMV